MENSFASIISSANSILILLPSKPYFDQVAAGMALYLGLKEKKETSIVCPTPMLVEFNRLVGVNKVASEMGSKNLVIGFADCKANEIEKVSADVENGELKLTVVPKAGFTSPRKEQVQLSYSGISADTIILIGGGNEVHFPALSSSDLAGARILHIGTRAISLSGGKTVLSFARPASSISELVVSLLGESGLGLDADIATNLLGGIEDGSRDFKGPDVTAETFETVANLLRAGGRRIPKERFDKSAFPPGAIPGEITQQEPEKKPASQGGEEPPKDWLEPKIFKGTSIS